MADNEVSHENQLGSNKKSNPIISLSSVADLQSYMQALVNNGNPFATGHTIDLNRFYIETAAYAFPSDAKTFNVFGDPMELTIECDYRQINVSGLCHRIYLIGICNKINFTGNLHSIFIDGYTNEVEFFTDMINGKCAIWGERLALNCRLGKSNGSYMFNAGPKPRKLDFPQQLREGQRRRFTWKPAPMIDAETFARECQPALEFNGGFEDINEVDMNENDEQDMD